MYATMSNHDFCKDTKFELYDFGKINLVTYL